MQNDYQISNTCDFFLLESILGKILGNFPKMTAYPRDFFVRPLLSQ